jgi:hypothetical protein
MSSNNDTASQARQQNSAYNTYYGVTSPFLAAHNIWHPRRIDETSAVIVHNVAARSTGDRRAAFRPRDAGALPTALLSGPTTGRFQGCERATLEHRSLPGDAPTYLNLSDDCHLIADVTERCLRSAECRPPTV